MKCAGTSVEYAIALKYKLGDTDICTGQSGYDENYGDWGKNVEKYAYLNNGKAEHCGPHRLEFLWDLLNFSKPISEFKKITIARDPLEQLVSYYWWAHRRPDMLAFKSHTCPLTGDTRKVVYRKFIDWVQTDYRAAIYKESEAPIETPIQTLKRINESMVAGSDIVLLYQNLARECQDKLAINFPLPLMKSGKKFLPDQASDYFYGYSSLRNNIYDAFPLTMEYLTKHGNKPAGPHN